MRFRLALVLGLAAALLLGRQTAAWHIGRGRATDGDTLSIGGAGFRLKGVAAPERKTPQGEEARAFVTSHFGGQLIACHETGQLSFSRYEAFCYTLTGQDIGAAVIRAGFACASSKPKWRVARYEALEQPSRPQDCGYGT
jgi:endonuclease YncB( thermonuclease family)